MVQTILQDSILHLVFTHKTSQERHRTHTPYADTSELQTLWVDSALRLELTKGACNQKRTNIACSIVSLDICLLLTKVKRNYAQKWIFYRQFLTGYSFSNCTVCVSFLSGIIKVSVLVNIVQSIVDLTITLLPPVFTDEDSFICYSRALYWWKYCGSNPSYHVTAFFRPTATSHTVP